MEATKTALRPEDFEIIQNRKSQGDQLVREPVTYWKDAWRRLRKNKIAMGSLFVLFLFLIMVIIGPYIRGYDYITSAPQYKSVGALMRGSSSVKSSEMIFTNVLRISGESAL